MKFPAIQKSIVQSLSLAISMASTVTSTHASPEQSGLEEVIVTSQFRDTKILELANSVSVFDQATINARGANNLEQLLNMAPNVNFAAGASRGRYIQIRGIGERSQFVDPVNPSVGLIIDGIDFTGLGLAASTLDIEQVEIFRGPQGTLYGANALAGLVNMQSHAPSATPMAMISGQVAEYNSKSLGVVASGPLTDRLTYRVAAQNQYSDGYIDNDYLDKDDTNNIDESIARAKLRFQESDDLQLDFSMLYIDVDNGYDAFTLDNSRNTLSDQPGQDTQETVAGSFSARYAGIDAFMLETSLSAAYSDTQYGFDEDWVYVGFHPDEYSSEDNYDRDKDNVSVDLRLISQPEHNIFYGMSSWVMGVYLRNEDEDLVRNDSFKSQFENENYAGYGQLRTALNDNFSVVTGLRFERRNAEYSDNLAVQSDNDEDFWGGNITLEHQYADMPLVYGTISRGYKAGGVNGSIISAAASNPDISSDVFEFDSEHMINYELGLKSAWLDNRLQAQFAAFYQDRSDVQAKQSIFDPNDFSFDDYLANAAGGKTTGIEMELNFLATDALRFFAAVGWLNAEFDNFLSVSHVDAKDDWNGIVLPPVDLDGREVAHAPEYQYFIGSELSLMANVIIRVEVEGKDEFYFSNSHDQQSSSYELVNARLTYLGSNWDVSLWGRNLSDEDYSTRGFYFSNQFGNNPANGYAPETYVQYGEPRVVGVSASYTF